MNIRIGAVAAGALVLVACGQAAPSGPNSVNGSPSAEAPSQEKSTASPSPKTTGSTAPSDRLFGHKVYSLEDALSTEVMGLKLNMSVDEVFQVLDGRKFEAFADGSGSLLTDAQKEDRQKLKDSIADAEFYCRQNNSRKCVPGAMQQAGYTWIRKGEDESQGFEGVVARFYLTADKEPKLYSADYVQDYGTKNSPPNVIGAMIDRFGEPTRDQSSVSREGIQTGRLRYYIQMPVPEGLAPANVDSRELDEDVEKQHPVQASRFSCLNGQYNNITAELSSACEQALSGNSKAYWMYEALARNREIHSGTNNMFLEIENYNTRLTIQLVGEMLPVAIKVERQEAQLRQMVEERKAQWEQTYDAPSDL